MLVATLEVRLYAPWVCSLKEKRSELRSLLAKIKNKFNVSVAETACQDKHQTIVIGIAAIAANTAQADSILGNIINFIQSSSQAEIVAVERGDL